MSFDFVDRPEDTTLSVMRGYTWVKAITDEDPAADFSVYTDIIMRISKNESTAHTLELSLLGGEMAISGANNEILTITIDKTQSNAEKAEMKIYELYFVDGAGQCLPFNKGRIEFLDSLLDS